MGINRRFIFNNYWWIAFLFFFLGAGFSFVFGGNEWVALIGAVIAGTLGFCYFVQQQKLSETVLFHKIFTDFNARYNDMNGELSDLVEERDISSEQRKVIVEYFNLCAEEYLFYQQGYVPKSVWVSWCRGMSWYLKRHPFKDVWNEEFKSESFYGLSLAKIHEGSTLN
jgi:hypothetical protein